MCGEPSKTFQLGLIRRTVLIDFNSMEQKQAVAAHGRSAYQASLDTLGDDAEREICMIEGV